MSESDSESGSLDDLPVYFRPFTRESLKAVNERMEEEAIKKEQEAKKEKKKYYDDDYEYEGPKPNPKLEQGNGLPIRLAHNFDPKSMAGIPLEDIDTFYTAIPTFVIITRKKDIFRFSATDAMWILSPFNPIRRIAIAVLTHWLFSLIIITTILVNCYVMILPASPVTEATEVVFTAIYTFESAVKVLARGFILEKFTYLRDAWNWLDFVVISLAYLTMGIDLGNLAALRMCRVFRALKTVAIVPGLKTIVGAVIESVKNLRDVIILTVFALSVFGLIGLQIYMGVLTQKCVRDFPDDGSEGRERDINWHTWNLNVTNWYPFPPPNEYGNANYPLCGNSSGAGGCPVNYTCLQGYGPNPNYGYTSFDSFGSAFLSAFRLMTQDFWESLYQQILRSAGPWHMLFFIVIIFLGSYYLVNLILAIVAMSYDELQKKAEEEEMADAAEMKAIKEEEEARVKNIAEHAAAAAAKAARRESHRFSSAGSYASSRKSCLSLAAAQDDGKSEPMKASGGYYNPSFVDSDPKLAPSFEPSQRGPFMIDGNLSLPGSPSFSRPGSRRFSRNKMIVFPSYMDGPDHWPHTDDSTPGTPRSEENGAVIHPTSNGFVGHPITKESQLIQHVKTLYGGKAENKALDGDTVSRASMEKLRQSEMGSFHYNLHLNSTRDDLRDGIELNDLIEQADGQSLNQTNEPEGEEPVIPLRARLKAGFIKGLFKFIDFFCLWDCGFPYNIFKKIVTLIIFDPFTELFITIMIVVNVIFMAMDHYGLQENVTLSAIMKAGNNVFTTVFTLESTLKIIAMSPKYFFLVGWNVFDFIIVAFSLIEVVFEDANLPGISALRSFRLLRVFKLAKSWPTLNMVMTIMGKTVGALSNLVFVFVIIIFIFAVMGMQLFAPDYFEKTHLFPGGEMPRWNFTDFGHSFLIVFRVLCGEWIESMWDCMLVSGGACVPFFLATVVIGNLVVLNLFLALLLSSFGNLSPSEDSEPNKLQEAFDRIGRFKRWVKAGVKKGIQLLIQQILKARNRIVPGISRRQAEQEAAAAAEAELKRKAAEAKKRRLARAARQVMNTNKLAKKNEVGVPAGKPENVKKDGDVDSIGSCRSRTSRKRTKNQTNGGGKVPDVDALSILSQDYSDDDWIDEEDDDEEFTRLLHGEEPEMPTNCMPPGFYKRFPIFAVEDTPFAIAWADLRVKAFHLIEDKYFETVVIFLILFSSAVMAFEDVYLASNPVLVDVLFYTDRVFTIVFFIEMLIKWLALGFNAYFHNAWCWLDFVIVMVSLVNFVAAIAGAGKVQAFKTMRTLRALRPLRAMSRMQGMRVVVNALIGAIPNLLNILLVCLIFWLIFAIMGVQLFNGKFHKCLDPVDGTRPDYRVIRNKVECLANNFTWENSAMNFDHVGKAYLCLFQVATFKGWIDIMNDAIDSREIDDQPHREVSFVMYLYFVVFIVFGSFFTLNLFIGVIIDNFNEQKKKSGGSLEMFMTEDQRKYYQAMQKMGSKKPRKGIARPSWKPQQLVFELVTNQKFDIAIMLLIGVNMAIMMLDHFQMSQAWDDTLNALNAVFVAIFTSECVLKIFALRVHYFREPWNLFDLVVVFMSLAGMMLSDLIAKYFVSPTLLRVVRVAKVGRVLRLIKGAKGIRTLLFALIMSLPALFNICLLLFLVMFIFAIFGMSFFMNVKLRGALNEVYNFRTFPKSFILLFQMSTSAGWDGVLSGIIDEEDCEPPDPEQGISGDCGNATVGIAFLLSYLVMTFLIVINMYIAVILENYSQATEDVQEGLTDEDYDLYYEIWAQFDPNGTQYIPYEMVSDLLHVLEPPLQIHKPNKFKIISMDIPICKGDMIFCVDILDALTKDFFARKGNPIEESPDILYNHQTRPGYEPISSTLWRVREDYCARLMQNAWKRRKATRLREAQAQMRANCPDGENSGNPDQVTSSTVHGPSSAHNTMLLNNSHKSANVRHRKTK